jgi:hypothetical protein
LTSPIEHCKECVDLLGEYIEGTLQPEQAKALEDHLSLCPPCILGKHVPGFPCSKPDSSAVAMEATADIGPKKV